jgi:PAS domain S-box-containing protein
MRSEQRWPGWDPGWAAFSAAVVAVIAGTDLLTGTEIFGVALLAVGPLVAAIRCRVRSTAAVAAGSVLAAVAVAARRMPLSGRAAWVDGAVVAAAASFAIYAAWNRQQMEARLRRREGRFRALIEKSPDGFTLMDANRRILDLSPSGERLLGYSKEELIGKRPGERPDVLHPEDRERALSALDSVLRRPGDSHALEYRIRRKDGRWIWVEATITNHLGDPQLRAIVLNYRDITERREIEAALRQSEARYRSIVEQNVALVCSHDAEGRILTVNAAGAAAVGTTPEALVGRSAREILDPRHRDQFPYYLATVLEIGEARGLMAVVDGSDRRRLLRYHNTLGRDASGGPIVYSVAIDVTDVWEAERALRRSEEKYREIFAGAPVGIFQSSRDGRFLSANAAMARLLGYDAPEELLKLDIARDVFADPEDRERLIRRFEDRELAGDIEVRLKRKDGSRLWALLTSRLVRDDAGQEHHFEGFLLDITDRKLAEARLRDSESRYRAVVDSSQALICTHDLEGRLLSINPFAAAALGRRAGELLGRSIRDLLPSGLRSDFDRYLIRVREEPSTSGLMKIRGADGASRIWQYHNVLHREEGREPVVFGVALDVTDRVRAERRLAESEARFRLIFEKAASGMVVSDMDRNILDANAAFCRLLGRPAADVVGHNLSEFTAPEDEARVRELREDARAGSRDFIDTEKQYLHPDGTRVWGRVTSVFLRGVGEDSPYAVSIVQDIDARKRGEQLMEAESRILELIATAAPLTTALEAVARMAEAASPGLLASLLLMDDDGVHIRHAASPSLPDEYVRAIDGSEIGPSAGSCGTAAWRKQAVYVADIETDPLWAAYKHLALPHGLRACWSTPIQSRDRKVLGTFAIYSREARLPTPSEKGIVQIATHLARLAIERRQAEAALAESERKYRDIVTHAPVGIYQTDRDGRILTANSGLARMLGYDSAADLLGRDMARDVYLDPALREKLIAAYEPRGTAMDLEVAWKRRDGTPVWVLLTSHAIRDEEGRTRYFEGFVTDVTSRKRAEDALRDSELRYRTLFDTIPQPVLVADEASLRILAVNDAAVAQYGYSREDFARLTVRDLRRPEEAPDLLAGGAGGRPPWSGIVDHRRSDGSLFKAEIHVYPLALDGRPVRLAVVADVTQRQRSEKELRTSREQLRALAMRLQEVREEERAEIAREIHDELGQSLTAVKMDLSWIARRAGSLETGGAREVADRTADAIGLVDATVRVVRRLATQLRPGILDDLGLLPAVEWQVEEFQKRTGISATFDSNVGSLDLDRDRSTAIFRILQETLTNISRHAEATHVEVALRSSPGEVSLQVCDNGRGIRSEEITSLRSLGLLGMRERAAALGGRLGIQARPEGGTRVELDLPRRVEGSEARPPQVRSPGARGS